MIVVNHWIFTHDQYTKFPEIVDILCEVEGRGTPEESWGAPLYYNDMPMFLMIDVYEVIEDIETEYYIRRPQREVGKATYLECLIKVKGSKKEELIKLLKP